MCVPMVQAYSHQIAIGSFTATLGLPQTQNLPPIQKSTVPPSYLGHNTETVSYFRFKKHGSRLAYGLYTQT